MLLKQNSILGSIVPLAMFFNKVCLVQNFVSMRIVHSSLALPSQLYFDSSRGNLLAHSCFSLVSTVRVLPAKLLLDYSSLFDLLAKHNQLRSKDFLIFSASQWCLKYDMNEGMF